MVSYVMPLSAPARFAKHRPALIPSNIEIPIMGCGLLGFSRVCHTLPRLSLLRLLLENFIRHNGLWVAKRRYVGQCYATLCIA